MESNKENIQTETKENIIIDNNDKTDNKKISKNSKISSKKKLPRVYLYFIYFIVFAFIGWLIETAYSYYS